MSNNQKARGALAQPSITRLITDGSGRTLDTRPLLPTGHQREIATKAAGFTQGYDVDVEVESRHTIQITSVEVVQSSVKIYEDVADDTV